MDQASLVKSDRDTGARVFDAVNKAGIPITFFDWKYIDQLQEWQLIIASPWVDTKGLHTANRALVDALRRAGVYEDIPMRRVFLRSPNDSIVKGLQSEAAEHNQGFLYLMKQKDRNQTVYSLMFAPMTSPPESAPVRLFETIDELRTFMTENLSIKSGSAEDVIAEMDRTDVGSLYPVTLTTRQIKRFGLA